MESKDLKGKQHELEKEYYLSKHDHLPKKTEHEA